MSANENKLRTQPEYGQRVILSDEVDIRAASIPSELNNLHMDVTDLLLLPTAICT